VESVSRALVIGSGGIKIAEAAEFDYSGSQALKALKDEGISTILVNPNIATIQTTHILADRIYLMPITPPFLEKVIEKERPDGVMVGFGGQSALTAGVQLYRSGVLSKYGVKVLGTPIEGVEAALTRSLFRKTMIEAGLPVPPSLPANSIREALDAAEWVGYPVIVRVSFNLGGRGSFVAYRREELEARLTRAFSHSVVGNILLEKYLERWKEIEFEVMRDCWGSRVAVSCLENIEPMGVHTGESMVVAPSQTLTDTEYQTLREASFGVASAIRLVGECNVQLALNQKTGEYYVIETNPRMSRSSALASKATGYPLAYIAAKLCLGYRLDELLNLVTKSTTAFFEPSLDYVVLKIPRWDLEKFWPVDTVLRSEMMSVGEVMAIGRNMEEVYQKALRMLDIGVSGLADPRILDVDESRESILERMRNFRPYWILDAAKAIQVGASIEELSELTGVDPFFLRPIERVVKIAEHLRNIELLDNEDRRGLVREAIRRGFTLEQIAALSGKSREELARLASGVDRLPWLKNIDTLAGERPAVTNYSYTTFSAMEDDVGADGGGEAVLLLGAGCFRIGVSVEFDWCTVNIYKSLTQLGRRVAIINYNPETVSTDWDLIDFLINAELTPEVIENIARRFGFTGVVISAAGQIGNNVAEELTRRGLNVMGTRTHSIGNAEDRSKFSRLLESLGIKQPRWAKVADIGMLPAIAEEVGYPVIVRPSYILSGTSVFVAYDEDELKELMGRLAGHTGRPILVSHFIENAIEAEVDCVSDGDNVLMLPLDHVEYAGVHSGDATMSIPPYRLDCGSMEKIAEYTGLLARALRVQGPFNIQYLVSGGEVYVIECNLRCSRSMPFSSKVYGIPLMEYATRCILGERLNLREGRLEELWDRVYAPLQSVWGVKSPQFSWAQIRGAYPFLGAEMRSTGEVAALGLGFHEALLKSWLSATPNRIPPRDTPILLYTDSTRNVEVFRRVGEQLTGAGYEVLTLQESPVPGLPELRADSAVKAIKLNRLGLLITCGYIPQIDYEVRRAAVDHNIPVILTAELALELSKAFRLLGEGSIRLEATELGEYWEINRGAVARLASREREWSGADE